MPQVFRATFHETLHAIAEGALLRSVRHKPTTASRADQVGLAALSAVGADVAILLDRELRILGATQGAIALLGEIPIGVAAPKVLCGSATQRPVAEALAAGRAIQTTIPHPSKRHEALRVSATPLREGRDRIGWLLQLASQPSSVEGTTEFHGMWSRDPAMLEMFRIIEKVAISEASVLVRGETGSGKELVANAIHALSRRSAGPFRALNCAAVPAPLLESELFGHTRGAFTGAVRDTPGHFKLAHGGTLFLDEIGELPLELQSKMLRVLETRSVMPIGANKPVPIDVRIITATHRALRKEVSAGRFRADLMYRLRVIPIFIPPLRARALDVVMLTEHIIAEMNARAARQITRISPGAQAVLTRYPWPGNVRELRNALEYAFAIGEGACLVESDLPPEIVSGEGNEAMFEPAASPALSAHAAPPLPERVALTRALERAAGNRERAAKSLGISRSTLWRRMKLLGLVVPEAESL